MQFTSHKIESINKIKILGSESFQQKTLGAVGKSLLDFGNSELTFISKLMSHQ